MVLLITELEISVPESPIVSALTEVTVPFVFEVPAPIAVLNSLAPKAETVLSALNLGKVTALGLLSVKIFPPTVVAPRFVLASVALLALVPPLTIGNTPVTPEVKGRPVPFVSTIELGVPKSGVTKVGEMALTTSPVPDRKSVV